jgi:hypothetical protein
MKKVDLRHPTFFTFTPPQEHPLRTRVSIKNVPSAGRAQTELGAAGALHKSMLDLYATSLLHRFTTKEVPKDGFGSH